MFPNSHWHILGPGAIGLLWASYWCQDNTTVTLIGTQNTQQVPLINSTADAAYTVNYHNISELNEPISHLLITTKAHATKQAFMQIKDHLTDQATIVVLQNGLEAPGLPITSKQSLYAGSTTDGAYRRSAFEIVHAGKGQTEIGLLQGEPEFDIDKLLKAMPSALKIRHNSNITQALWRKLAINCAINPLTIKYNCKNGGLLNDEKALKDIDKLCAEIKAVAKKINPDPWFDELTQHVKQVLSTTSDNINSMLQDIRANKTTEIDQLNGYICKEAKSLGIDTPTNEGLVVMIHERQTNGQQ